MAGSISDLERAYYITALGLSAAVGAGMSLSDLRMAFYSNPPAGGGGGLDLTNSTGTLNADKIVNGSTQKVYTSADQAKLAGIASGATANSSDATLLNRANHTGTQSLDTTTDSATRAVLTPAAVTKVGTVATGATANSSDATLLARANHTGTQTASTVSDFTEATQDVTGAFLQDGVGFDVTYNDAGNAMTVAVTGSDGYKIFWNDVTDTWPARPTPDGVHFYEFYSAQDATATIPPDMVIGDNWTRHPSSVL